MEALLRWALGVYLPEGMDFINKLPPTHSASTRMCMRGSESLLFILFTAAILAQLTDLSRVRIIQNPSISEHIVSANFMSIWHNLGLSNRREPQLRKYLQKI